MPDRVEGDMKRISFIAVLLHFGIIACSSPARPIADHMDTRGWLLEKARSQDADFPDGIYVKLTHFASALTCDVMVKVEGG